MLVPLKALILGAWLVGQVDLGYRQYLAAEAVRDYGGFVFYASDFVGDARHPGRPPVVPAAIRRLVGEDFFQDVVEVNLVYGEGKNRRRIDVARDDDAIIPRLVDLPGLRRLYIQKNQANDRSLESIARLKRLEVLMMWDARVTDDGIARLKALTDLRNLHVSNAGLGDESLRHLAALPRIESLSLQGNRFTDRGLAHLAGMKNLRQLVPDLGESTFTDEGLAHLAGLTRLEQLGLQKSRVTDAGLKHLEGLTNLTELWIGETAVTEEGLARLRVALPRLKPVR